MRLNLIIFSASTHKPSASIDELHSALLSKLKDNFVLHYVFEQDLPELDNKQFSIVFINSGGVEKNVAKMVEFLPKPVFLLADGLENSLASALEIAAWLRSQGIRCEILHGENDFVINRITLLSKIFVSQQKLAKSKIGVIGTPSNWLIASDVDYLLSKRRWGIEYVDIDLERVIEQYNRISEDEVGDQSVMVAQNAADIIEGTAEDLINAMRMYKAIETIAKVEQLDALTLSCFQLVEKTGVTGCLALSLLNDNGIISGCEGDLQSIFTMLLAKILTGKDSFMGNPSKVDITNNELVLAHCTIGLKQTDRYLLRNHFETGKSISIQGIMPIGNMTLLKCGGECLDQYYVSSGTLVENTRSESFCRTQVKLSLHTPVSYFLNNPIGNHHILLRDDYSQLFDEFFKQNGCLRIT